MYRIINHYAELKLMLPKSYLQLYENIRDYSVVLDTMRENRMVACGALHVYWEDLAELRAIAVDPHLAQRGAGTLLVHKLLDEADELGISRLFLFTYVPRFFLRFGFQEVSHQSIPLKVYNECFHCPNFNACDEIAMELKR
jgi:amino-acid N-acetyltransferase